MKAEQFKTIAAKDFPRVDFFDYLEQGTRFYQAGNFGRAIESFTEARLLDSYYPVTLADPDDDSVSYKGQIDKVPLLFLMYPVQGLQLSGVGIVQEGARKRKIIFKDGHLIRAASQERKDRIGNYLVRRKVMTPEQLDHHDQASKKMRRRIGSYLVLKKLISQKTLNELLALQTEEIFSRILLWKDGAFFFKETPVKEHPCVNYTPVKMALNVSIRGFHFKDFRREIPNNKIIFKPTSHAERNREEILEKLNTNDQFIFFLVDGTRNIDQLIRFSGNDEMSVINILYKLCSLGLVRKTREIREYEDRMYNEVRMILGVLFDIYHIVINELTEELGRQGREIIRAAQASLDLDHGQVFARMDLQHREQMKINTILQNVAGHFPHEHKRFIFIDAFLEIYGRSLEGLRKYLGVGLRKKTVKQMQLIIENLERFSIDTDLKSYMVKHLKQLIQQPGGENA